jgi:hypothetical protein
MDNLENISEIFDKPVDAYPVSSEDGNTYSFVTSNGSEYVVDIFKESEDRISIDFGIRSGEDLDYPETNAGDLYRVMSTIISVARDYIEKNPEINIISWQSIGKPGEIKIGDTQRDKLYKLILKRQGGLKDDDIVFKNGEWWVYLKGYDALFEMLSINTEPLMFSQLEEVSIPPVIPKPPMNPPQTSYSPSPQQYKSFSALTNTLQTAVNEIFTPKYNNDNFKELLLSLTTHLKEKLNVSPLPKVTFINTDVDNAKNILGKTAYYDPNNRHITLYTLNRHPKDVLRSFAHEMVHHMQNIEGRLHHGATTNVNEDEYLKTLEEEAYKVGNIEFRTWENQLQND